MIKDNYSLERILEETETILSIEAIDVNSKSFDTLLEKVRVNINRQYNIDLREGKQLSEQLDNLGVCKTTASVFMENLTMMHSKICGLTNILRFTRQTEVALNHISYCGVAVNSMLEALQYLQADRSYRKAEITIKYLEKQITEVMTCNEKRLLVILLIAFELGIEEIVMAIAEYLYCCCALELGEMK